MASKSPRITSLTALGSSRDKPTATRVVQLPTADSDIALVRGYSRELKIACDELHDDPFNPTARQELIRLILRDSKSADAAKERLHGVAAGQ
ncbi:hypothetical protein [Mycobacterium sp. NPDC006124]|uniref:hypothetical protein n=1 Tax=Mycobacterium sp. NPDC006124 TaxID=3156729 RepID=UPI0033B79973